MRRIGTVVRTPGGLAVARLAADDPDDDQLPAIGTELVDEHLDSVGRVVEVMGPIDRPYVVVSPAADRTGAALVGTTCYAR
jgi:RNA-binding protein